MLPPPLHPRLLPATVQASSGTDMTGLQRPAGWLREHRVTLQRHVADCHQARSRWYSLSCAAELMHGLLAPRFVTTVAAVTLALALSAWWM